MDIKTVITDLDGTLLLPDGTVGDYSRGVFKRLREKNIDIHIATGRPLSGALISTRGLELAPEMAVFNGTQLYHRHSEELFQNKTLPQNVVEHAIKRLEEEDMDYFIYHEEVRYRREGRHYKISKNLDQFFHGVQLVKDPDSIPKERCPRVAFWGLEHELIELTHEFRELPDIYVESFPFSAIETFPDEDLYFVEIHFFCEGKVELLRWLEKERGITPEQVMAFGDQNNDISLLKAAGYGFAVANAFKPCLEAADEIIESNAQEAVAKKLEELFL